MQSYGVSPTLSCKIMEYHRLIFLDAKMGKAKEKKKIQRS